MVAAETMANGGYTIGGMVTYVMPPTKIATVFKFRAVAFDRAMKSTRAKRAERLGSREEEYQN